METLKVILVAQKIMILPLTTIFLAFLFLELVPYNGFIFKTLNFLVLLLAYSWLYVVWITNRRVYYNSVWPKPFDSKIFKVWMFQLKLWIAVSLISTVIGIIFTVIGLIFIDLVYFMMPSAMDNEMSMALSKAITEDWEMESEMLIVWIITVTLILPILILLVYTELRFGYGTYSLAISETRTTLRGSWKLSKGMSKQALRYAISFTAFITPFTGLTIWITYPIYNSDPDLFGIFFIQLLNIAATAFWIEMTAAFYKNVGDKQNLSQNNLTNKPLVF